MTFNAARARAKRPCPLWVDAFQRDTQHLAADEVGAYMLLLMAMWTRESCDFPDDDRRLAAVCRVSPRLWKARIGPVIREFLTAENGALIQKRLREEATYVERQCKAQSDRKSGEKSDNPLNDNDPPASTDKSTDATADKSPEHPSQQPNNQTVYSDPYGSDGVAVDAKDELFKKYKDWLVSCGVSPDNARSVIGKWLKSHSAAEVRAAFIEAWKANTGDPVPYIAKILNGQRKERDVMAEVRAHIKTFGARHEA
jgi:uncharacterized protein YdaU (DUF1376 family)